MEDLLPGGEHRASTWPVWLMEDFQDPFSCRVLDATGAEGGKGECTIKMCNCW